MALDRAGVNCLNPERLAEYADGVLTQDVRAEMERHLADCPECRAVLAETTAFLATAGAAAPDRPVPVAPFRARRWVSVAGTLAIAAALVLAVRVARPDWLKFGRTDRPELRELISALGNEPTRPIEGRLTGGFKYAPPPLPTRGGGEREVSPDVKIAAAKIERLANTNDTPAMKAALGVGYLTLHDFDRAVLALERATQDEPGNARFQSDLAAAYLARATWRSRAEDLPKALAAAERAIGADSHLAEAYFNRALALEGLHLDAQALDAWSAYGNVERSSAWATEAAARATAAKSRATSKTVAPSESHQEIREQIEDQLLAQWGAAEIADDLSSARSALDESDVRARSLAMDGGDTMPLDEVALIERATSSGRRSALRSLAEAHVLYGRARREFLSDRLQQASGTMADAAVAFGRAHSPYAAWAPIYNAIALRIGGSAEAALAQLAVSSPPHSSERYFNFRGRLAWTRAAALETLGRFDQAHESLQQAVTEFAHGGEIENLAINEMGLAEAEWFLGEKSDMWAHEIGALSRLQAVHSVTRRNAVLLEAATFALSDQLPESALQFQNALIELVDKSRLPLGRADAYRGRARILWRLDHRDAALRDLDTARQAVAEIEDMGLRARAAAEVNRVRAEVLVASNPRAAVEAATAAVAYAHDNAYAIRTAELLTLRARAYEALHVNQNAEQDFRSAIDALEHVRTGLAKAQDRMQGLEDQREAFQGFVQFEALTLANPESALDIAEQGRARTLLDQDSGSTTAPLDPIAARGRLPHDTVVVYYAVLTERVLVWVLTSEGHTYFSRSFAATRLNESVRQLHGLVDQNAVFSRFAAAAKTLSEQLVLPALELAPSKTRVVFVPDGSLAGVPFGILPDREGRPIITRMSVLVAPSFTSLLVASARLAAFSPRSVLAVGDGQDPATTGFARLTKADDEAIAVGQLYPNSTVLTGRNATRTRFMVDDRDVIHFAGHTVSSGEFPMFSRILLAPDPARGDLGSVLASDLLQHHFITTRVIVLASCEGAAGRVVQGEGMLSIARSFLQAGVPSVVANLWIVDDQVHPLLTAFHRELLIRSDPATALRLAQLHWLNERGWNTPVRVWGGFIALGGINSSVL